MPKLAGPLQDWEYQTPRQGSKGQPPLGGARGVLAPSPLYLPPQAANRDFATALPKLARKLHIASVLRYN